MGEEGRAAVLNHRARIVRTVPSDWLRGRMKRKDRAFRVGWWGFSGGWLPVSASKRGF